MVAKAEALRVTITFFFFIFYTAIGCGPYFFFLVFSTPEKWWPTSGVCFLVVYSTIGGIYRCGKPYVVYSIPFFLPLFPPGWIYSNPPPVCWEARFRPSHRCSARGIEPRRERHRHSVADLPSSWQHTPLVSVSFDFLTRVKHFVVS